MDDANVPIGSIQRILGHENRKTTEIYEDSRTFSHTNPHTLADFPETKSA